MEMIPLREHERGSRRYIGEAAGAFKVPAPIFLRHKTTRWKCFPRDLRALGSRLERVPFLNSGNQGSFYPAHFRAVSCFSSDSHRQESESGLPGAGPVLPGKGLPVGSPLGISVSPPRLSEW